MKKPPPPAGPWPNVSIKQKNVDTFFPHVDGIDMFMLQAVEETAKKLFIHSKLMQLLGRDDNAFAPLRLKTLQRAIF